MAKRESKKSVSLTDPKPNADDWTKFYELQGKKTINDKVVYCWGVAFINDIFRRWAIIFGSLPSIASIYISRVLKQSFALKDTEGNTNLVASEKKVESEEENKEVQIKLLTVSNTKRDAQLAAQLEQVSDKLYSLQQRVQKLEKDQKEFDTQVSSQRLNRLTTDEKQIKLYMPKEAANSDQSILIKIQDIKSELNDLKAQLQDKKLFDEGNKRDISILQARKPVFETGAAIDVPTPKLLQMGVGQLANSIALGQDFSFQLALIEQLVGEDPKVAAIVEELRPIALRGVKSKNFLKDNFIEKIDRISIPTTEEKQYLENLNINLNHL